MSFRFLLLFIGLSLSAPMQAQVLDTLINRVNFEMNRYRSVSPWDEAVALDSTGLSPEERLEFLREGYAEGDSQMVEPFSLQEYYRYRVDSAVHQLFKHPDLMEADLESRLNGYVIHTTDRRFLQISFEENTGGSYRSNITYYLYRGPQGTFGFDGYDADVLNRDGYYRIIPLGTSQDTSIYLYMGSVRGCNTCYGQYFGTFQVSTSGIEERFSFHVDTRSWGEVFDLDFSADGDSIVRVLYEADDLNNGCYCGAADENRTFKDPYEREGPRYCYLKFRYHQFNFYLLEQRCLYFDPMAEEIYEEMMWDVVK